MTSSPPGPAARGRGGLGALSVGFALFGAFWGSWAVSAADVQRALRLGTGGFGLLLSAALAGAAVSNAVGGTLTERHGLSRVLGASFIAWAAAVTALALVPGRVPLAAAVVMTVLAAGLVDVGLNVDATAALGSTPGRLVRFHARFNLGAAGGAALTGTLIGAHHSWRWTWLGVAGVAAALGVVFLRRPPDPGRPGTEESFSALRQTVAVLRRERLVVLALAFAAAAMVENGVELWGVLYMRVRLDSGLLVGAGGAVAGYLVAASARLGLGGRAGSRGAGRGVMLGGITAAAGATLMATAPGAPEAAVGLVLAAGGVSMCWPLLLAHATGGRAGAGSVIGAVSAVGYLGFVVGPTVVGWVAEGAGLRAGLGVLAVVAVFVAVAPVSGGMGPAGSGTSTVRRSQDRSAGRSAPVNATAAGAATTPSPSWTRGGRA